MAQSTSSDQGELADGGTSAKEDELDNGSDHGLDDEIGEGVNSKTRTSSNELARVPSPSSFKVNEAMRSRPNYIQEGDAKRALEHPCFLPPPMGSNVGLRALRASGPPDLGQCGFFSPLGPRLRVLPDCGVLTTATAQYYCP